MSTPWVLDELSPSPRAETPSPVPTLPEIDVEDEEGEIDEGNSEPLELFDPGAIVEEAELLLRESAPHDYDVLVIGAGTGGCAAALQAAELGVRVGLIEARHCGGAYLNRGGLQLIAMLRAANLSRETREAAQVGLQISPAIDFTTLKGRAQLLAAEMRGELEDQLLRAKVDIIAGSARFVTEHALEVTGPEGAVRQISAVHIIIATGSIADRATLSGADLPGVIATDEVHELESIPRRSLVVGSRASGFEIAYLLNELGSRTTLLEAGERFLPHEDPVVGSRAQVLLQGYGVTVETDARLLRLQRQGAELWIDAAIGSQRIQLQADCVILADWRRPNTENLDLERVGIVQDKGRILIDTHGETSVGGVYAVGSCTATDASPHRAAASGTVVAEIICGRRPSIDLHHAPNCYYTYPEMATVGLNDDVARADGYAVRGYLHSVSEIDVARMTGQTQGFVKLVWEEGTRKLLGCHIVGPRACELIHQAAICLRAGQPLKEMARMLCAHRSHSQALIAAARAALKHD